VKIVLTFTRVGKVYVEYRGGIFNMEFLPVASSEGVTIFCPQDGLYSLFNSPYPAHRLASGLDIYPESSYAPSPVSGVVLKTRKVRAPAGRGFQDDGFDAATLIQSLENPRKTVKILHVNPTVTEGQKIEVGQNLGTMIRSGYYGWATSPHIHVEVREPDDPIRARGGHIISRKPILSPQNQLEELAGRVAHIRPEYTILTLKDDVRYGLVADIGGRPGVLDGGIPYYGWFGAHFDGDSPRGLTVNLCGTNIGVISKVGDNWCQAEILDFHLKAEGTPIRGLSLRISPAGKAQMKLVPFSMDSLNFDVDNWVRLDLE
jgi:hypothetical protein